MLQDYPARHVLNPCGAAALRLPALLVPVEIVALLLMLGGEVVKPDAWMYWLSG